MCDKLDIHPNQVQSLPTPQIHRLVNHYRPPPTKSICMCEAINCKYYVIDKPEIKPFICIYL